MSQHFDEGGIEFDFPDDWAICRPGASSFYVRHFRSFCGGSKEMDFLAYDAREQTLWMIEVKDYRVHLRAKITEIPDEIAQKTRDTLALLKVSAVRDTNAAPPDHRQVGTFARTSSAALRIRVVVHCELPASPSKLYPGIKDRANMQAKITQKLRVVDPRDLFTNVRYGHYLPWTVTG